MTIQDLADKIEYEGGVALALDYFGPLLPYEYEVHEDLRKAWTKAYWAIMEVHNQLPPSTPEDYPFDW